jgi:hypothetical protein
MSRYDEYLKDLRASTTTAYEYIPKMCQALREEDKHISNEDIKERVTKDCLDAGLSKGTIIHNIPQEFKDPVNVEKGKKGSEKKKEKALEILTDGKLADPIEVGQTPVSQKEVDLGSSGSEEQEQPEEEEEDDDVEFLKKRLVKYVDDVKLKDVIIDNKDKEIGQLQEALKKTSFEPATDYKPPSKTFQWPEPDESNTFVFMDTTFDELRRALGPLKAGGNTKINVYLERVKN